MSEARRPFGWIIAYAFLAIAVLLWALPLQHSLDGERRARKNDHRTLVEEQRRNREHDAAQDAALAQANADRAARGEPQIIVQAPPQGSGGGGAGSGPGSATTQPTTTTTSRSSAPRTTCVTAGPLGACVSGLR